MNEDWKLDFEARLRAIDWAKLKDGSGALACEVPDDMMRFVEAGEYQGEFNDFFYTNLTHQQTCGEATLVAVPFLVELMDYLPAAQEFLIQYLVDIAVGMADWHYPQGYREAGAVGAYMTEQLTAKLHQEVSELAFPKFLDFASEYEDDYTREVALWSLGWFPMFEEKSRPILEAAPEFGAQFALQMLDAAKRPYREKTDEEMEADEEKYDEIRARIF